RHPSLPGWWQGALETRSELKRYTRLRASRPPTSRVSDWRPQSDRLPLERRLSRPPLLAIAAGRCRSTHRETGKEPAFAANASLGSVCVLRARLEHRVTAAIAKRIPKARNLFIPLSWYRFRSDRRRRLQLDDSAAYRDRNRLRAITGAQLL